MHVDDGVDIDSLLSGPGNETRRVRIQRGDAVAGADCKLQALREQGTATDEIAYKRTHDA
jgi:hypothetical protein